MKKNKILYVHHSGNFGGAPKSLSYIIRNLDKSKFSSKLINISEGPINSFFLGLPCELEVVKGIRPFHGATVVEKSFRQFVSNYKHLIPSLFRAYRILKTERPNILHLNSTCLFVFAIAGSFLKIPVVVHVREPLRSGLWGFPLRFFCKLNADGIIAISKFDFDSLKPRSNIFGKVIYNCVESFEASSKRSFAIRTRLGLSESDVIFVYLARFAKGNGWVELINWGSYVSSINRNLHFVLFGAEAGKDYGMFLSSNVHILPFQPDIDSVLRDSDVFVCPFTEPHFARGVIEASAFSIPILASNIGGVNELVRHGSTGFLYNSKEEFVEYSIKLANSFELRSSLGMAGYEFAIEKFSMELNLNETYSFYDNFL